MIEAAKEEIFPSFPAWCADPASAARMVNPEKSRQGIPPQNPALNPGIVWSNSTTALGMRGLGWENRVRSRCTGKERDSESGLDNFGADSDRYKDAQRAIDAYGKAGVDNGVTIQVGDTGKYGGTTTVAGGAVKTAYNPTGQKIEVKLSAGLAGDAVSEAHEGSHVADGSAWVASGFSSAMNPTKFQTEMRAYRVTDTIGEGLGYIVVMTMSFRGHPAHTYLLDHIAWPEATKDAAISNIINHEYPNSQVKAFQRNTRGGQ